jgi:exodeoxyribonuclease V alpha subunit
LAYACTVHKSQGSEYPAVIVVIYTRHYQILKRNLVYTGIMRGKRLVVRSAAGKLSGLPSSNPKRESASSG